jgi:hypothetical protein
MGRLITLAYFLFLGNLAYGGEHNIREFLTSIEGEWRGKATGIEFSKDGDILISRSKSYSLIVAKINSNSWQVYRDFCFEKQCGQGRVVYQLNGNKLEIKQNKGIKTKLEVIKSKSFLLSFNTTYSTGVDFSEYYEISENGRLIHDLAMNVRGRRTGHSVLTAKRSE